MDDPVVALGILAAYLFILGAGGIVADYVLPHVPPIRRWIDSLPEKDDDSEIYQREMEQIRRNRETRRRWAKRMVRRMYRK